VDEWMGEEVVSIFSRLFIKMLKRRPPISEDQRLSKYLQDLSARVFILDDPIQLFLSYQEKSQG
jgi:hypothetical protein